MGATIGSDDIGSCSCQLPEDDAEDLSGSNAWSKALEFLHLNAVSFSLLAAVKLKVFDVLAKHHPHQQLSASQILSHISPNASSFYSSSSLDRLLRFLASHSLLNSSLSVADPVTTLYGLTPTSKYFVQDHRHTSFAPLLLATHHRAIMDSGLKTYEAILDGVPPFSEAHATDFFTYAPGHPELHELFNSAMVNHSKLLMRSVLRVYGGFEALTSIVDVGGGFGACVNSIVEKYPHIKGINFDQPHVIRAAPSYQVSVKHVEGDMFDSIPQADAIFMKWILHDWSNEDCIKILRNCYLALPTNGRVIVLDTILPNKLGTDVNSRLSYGWDQLMFLFTQGGRERTERELRELAQIAGFFKFQVVCKVNEFSVVEMYKP